MKLLKHIVTITAILFLFIGLPCIYYRNSLFGFFAKDDTDAVAGASVLLPDKPSGRYVILINKRLHSDTLGDWEAFFREEPVGVIFEDVECIVMDADMSANQLAERYMLRLPENQMRVRKENGLLAASKAQWNKYDMMMISKELADAYGMDIVYDNADTHVINVEEIK